MKMSAIKKICQNEGKFVIWNGMGQWIGTEKMCFRVEGVNITSEAIPAIFDLNEKKMEKLTVEEAQLEESGLFPYLGWEEGKQMTDQGVLICLGAHELIFLEAERKMYALDMDAVRGAVGSGEYRSYYLSENGQHEPIILICDGMITCGIAKPESGRAMAEIQKKLRELGMIPSGAAYAGEDDES